MDSQTVQNASVTSLPVELLLRIAAPLRTKELAAMRLTCKHFERALFHSFASEYFAKKQFMLSDNSLQALLNIARHPALASSVKHVIIGLDRFEHTESGPDDQEVFRHVEAAKQLHLLRTGRAVRMLAEAFAKLPNLETVDMRDFNSRRTRDGPGARWRSYGASQIGAFQIGHAAAGRTMHVSGMSGDDLPTMAFTIVLAALAESGARPPNLEAILRTRFWGVRDCAFFIPSGDGDATAAVVAGLRRLHLDVSLLGEHTRLPWTTLETSSPTHGLLLHRFLSQARNLTWLRLNFQGEPNRNICNAFLNRLGEGGSPMPATELPNLQQLDLGLASFSLPPLIGVISRFPHLTSLRLWKIEIVSDAVETRKPTAWIELLQWLQHLRDLKLISVGYAGQKIEGSRRLHVLFNGKQTFQYQGSELGQFIKTLVPRTRYESAPLSDSDGGDFDGEDPPTVLELMGHLLHNH